MTFFNMPGPPLYFVNNQPINRVAEDQLLKVYLSMKNMMRTCWEHIENKDKNNSLHSTPKWENRARHGCMLSLLIIAFREPTRVSRNWKTNPSSWILIPSNLINLWTDNFQRRFSQLGCQSKIDLIYWDIFLVIQVIIDFCVTIVAFKVCLFVSNTSNIFF